LDSREHFLEFCIATFLKLLRAEMPKDLPGVCSDAFRFGEATFNELRVGKAEYQFALADFTQRLEVHFLFCPTLKVSHAVRCRQGCLAKVIHKAAGPP
jgi:hypothetical protein